MNIFFYTLLMYDKDAFSATVLILNDARFLKSINQHSTYWITGSGNPSASHESRYCFPENAWGVLLSTSIRTRSVGSESKVSVSNLSYVCRVLNLWKRLTTNKPQQRNSKEQLQYATFLMLLRVFHVDLTKHRSRKLLSKTLKKKEF